MSITAGQRLKDDLDAALAQAVAEHGPLVYDELDHLAIDRAAACADRAEQLRALFDEEIVGQARSSALTRLSAEARACDRMAMDVVRTIANGLGTAPKSERHQRAANSRWDRQPRSPRPRPSRSAG